MSLISYAGAALLLVWIAFGVWGAKVVIESWNQEPEVRDYLAPEPKSEKEGN